MTTQHADDPLALFPTGVLHFVSRKGIGRDVFSRRLKAAFPEYFKSYQRMSIRRSFEVGQTLLFPLNTLFGTEFIVSMVIKDSWQEKTRPENVRKCLACLGDILIEKRPVSIATSDIADAPTGWLEKQLQVIIASASPESKILFARSQSEICPEII